MTRLVLMFLLPLAALAHNELREVKLTSCRPGVCTTLETKKSYRSTLQPHIIAFSEAKMTLVSATDRTKVISQFEGQDGYYDLEEQVIVLRGLKKSLKSELIYDLTQGKFLFF